MPGAKKAAGRHWAAHAAEMEGLHGENKSNTVRPTAHRPTQGMHAGKDGVECCGGGAAH